MHKGYLSLKFSYEIKKIILAGNILLAGLTILSYLSRILSPQSSGVISILGLVYSGMIVCHFILAIGWLIFGPRRYTLISLLFLLLEVCCFNNWFNFSLNTLEAPKTTLNVGTLNLQFGKELSILPSDLHDEYLSLIPDLNELDILCVQEYGDFNKQFIDFPYKHILPLQYVGIFSKYPIIRKGSVNSSFNSANDCLWADILYLGDTIRVYSAHLESNRQNGVIPTSVDQSQDETKNTFSYVGLLKHYIRFSTMRQNQAIAIRAHQKKIDLPTIIAGDFNDVPLSSMYYNISQDLKDTFIESGWGSGNTLNTIIPGLRIDYILTTPHWEIYNHKIKKKTYSDHYLVTSKISL